ncbi:thiamine pyrophosphate-binding protein [Achromobacter piechaudii]|uniref:Thiamine pyrophosphate enzyme, C-terminal TPP binding domain protein n=1 Tax=Achromobacter piechaudii ATCC 43553 TaxID=742159 RepID=D4XE33_9BURK|nr:thiamine pyrophosphate-binding protein [Achromobacter piechaudii]EFF74936.1 thiamine pyrophosphate enzyme, C-terminal TPP binding domain protein [Achromobacter piechaudii ATCC 43553]
MSEKLEITGGEAIARMFAAHDVGLMFGMGGFQLLPFYDAVRRLNLNHHLINDERCAVFAADAYTKVSGRPGVCDATLGPGATNLVTGLAEAFNAGTPLVALVGDSHRLHSWKNMTQEARQLEVLRPVVKDVLRVEMIERIPELVRRAFAVATSGRPGPVVLDVPEDIAHAVHAFDADAFYASANARRAPALRCRPDADDLAQAASMLAGAARPLMLCGGGVHISEAAQAVQTFARRFNIPVAHTMSGKGAIACSDPLNAGLFGRYSRIANDFIAKADCLFVVGCKLGEVATRRYELLSAGAPIIHLDVVAEEFDRTTTPALRLWGDARATLEELTERMADQALQTDRQAYADEVGQAMHAWRESVRGKLTSTDSPIGMARLMNEINATLPEDGILVADGGFAAHWGGLLFDTKRAGRGFVPDRGFASIGYGIPGAIGAAAAAPGRQVVSLTGDGGCNMSLGELETAVRMGLAFTLVVVNNAASGYIKALQHLMYGSGSYQSSDLVETNYANVARALGCNGIRVEDPADIQAALANAYACKDRPTILDVVVTRDPAHMLPGVDSRAAKIKPGDRIA